MCVSMRPGPLAVGMLVLAEFPEDQCKYRARIMKVDVPSISVFYIDYGNTCDVQWAQIFKLADKFLDIPEMVRSNKNPICRP